MELGRLHHTAIDVSDYDRARAFYVEKLGFSVLGEYVYPSGTRRLDCRQGEARLEIFQSSQVQARPDGRVPGCRHLAFHVTDLEKAVAELEEKGIPTSGIREDTMAGGRMAFFWDPDGTELELYQQRRDLC